MSAAVIETNARGVYTDMEAPIARDDIVEVWTGAVTGSPHPPQPGDSWLEAKVLEVKGNSFWISWTGPRPGAPWVPRAAIRRKS
jgi:hypothetical protein